MITIETNGVKIEVPRGGAVAIRQDGRLLLTIRNDGGFEPGGNFDADKMWINVDRLPELCGRSGCPLIPSRSVEIH